MRKVGWRIVPFLIACYLVSYIDRVNIGFAALTMNRDLGLSSAAFGIGGGLFFVAYVAFEVPSNLAQQRFGPRVWMARIMVTWGCAGLAMAFVQTPVQFCVLRFLIGAAEAGFFPGAILYLSQWFPRAYRARIVATFMVAIPLSSVLGSPVSTALLSVDAAGLAGWRWLFIAESIPAILLGVAALLVLRDRPHQARWLDAGEKAWLTGALAAEPHPAEHGHRGVRALLSSGDVWLLALIYCGSSATSNALSVWQPQIIASFGMDRWTTGLLNMVPFGAGAAFMVFWGRVADRSGERVLSTAVPLALTSSCLLLTLVTSSLPVTIALLSLVLIGNYAIKGPFWALADETLPPSVLAGGLAAINALAHLGTGLATALLGVIRGQTGSFPLSLTPLAFLTGLGVIATVRIGRARLGRGVA